VEFNQGSRGYRDLNKVFNSSVDSLSVLIIHTAANHSKLGQVLASIYATVAEIVEVTNNPTPPYKTVTKLASLGGPP
jgi:hypothetical protein